MSCPLPGSGRGGGAGRRAWTEAPPLRPTHLEPAACWKLPEAAGTPRAGSARRGSHAPGAQTASVQAAEGPPSAPCTLVIPSESLKGSPLNGPLKCGTAGARLQIATNSPLTESANCLLFDLLGSTQLNNLSHGRLIINNVAGRFLSCLGDRSRPVWRPPPGAPRRGAVVSGGRSRPGRKRSRDGSRTAFAGSRYRQMRSLVVSLSITVFVAY